MKADKIIERLEIAEKLINSAKESAKDRQSAERHTWGTPGKNSNGNIKDKIRIARGLLMEVSNGLDWDSFKGGE